MQIPYTLKAIAIAAFIAASCGIMTPAYAINTQSDLVATTIDSRDLQTDHGIAKVYKSLERRAEAACDSQGKRTLTQRNFEKLCMQSLLNDFIVDVNHDGLTSYYNAMQSKTS